MRDKPVVGILTPSHPSPARFRARFDYAVRALQVWGFEVKLSDGCLKDNGFTAGNGRSRAEDFNSLVTDPEVDIIMATIGGFNTNDMLPYVNFDSFAKSPKAVIGTSDFTVLLNALVAATGVETYLGPSLMGQWGEYPDPDAYTLSYFGLAMTGRSFDMRPSTNWTAARGEWGKGNKFARLKADLTRWRPLRRGFGQGRIFGGNLETLNMLVGTPHWRPPDEIILLIEATGEEAYLPRFERALSHLRQAGLFDKCAALLVGRCPDATVVDSITLDDVIMRQCQEFQFPIIMDVDFGHSDPMLTFPLNRVMSVTGSEDGCLLVCENTALAFRPPVPERILGIAMETK